MRSHVLRSKKSGTSDSSVPSLLPGRDQGPFLSPGFLADTDTNDLSGFSMASYTCSLTRDKVEERC